MRVSVSACAQALGKPISGKIQTDEAKINLLLLVRRGGTPKGWRHINDNVSVRVVVTPCLPRLCVDAPVGLGEADGDIERQAAATVQGGGSAGPAGL